MQYANNVSQSLEVLYDLEEGFLKGSIWRNLYSKYKYVPKQDINHTVNKNDIIYMIQIYTFAVTELTFYIATHPDNNEAINMLKKISLEREKIYNYYEANFLDLDMYSTNTNYTFLNGMWPWECN